MNFRRPTGGDPGPSADAGRQPGSGPGAQGQQKNLQPFPPPAGAANPGQRGEFWASLLGSQVGRGAWAAEPEAGEGAASVVLLLGCGGWGGPALCFSISGSLAPPFSHSALSPVPLSPLSPSSALLPPPCSLTLSTPAPFISRLSLPHQPGFFSKLAAMFRGLIFHSSRSSDREVRASDGC